MVDEKIEDFENDNVLPLAEKVDDQKEDIINLKHEMAMIRESL
jgi:hypothetical protein